MSTPNNEYGESSPIAPSAAGTAALGAMGSTKDRAAKYFRGKRITVMGLGLLGRGVGDAHYLAGCGAELIVTDLKSHEDLAESLDKLKNFSNIKFVLGEHRLEDFRDRDLILKAAGVPLDSPYIAEAKKHSVSVRMSADLFMEISGVQTIGITGTRGKSTVTHMLLAILKEAEKPVVLGGNVRGVSTLALLSEVTPAHTAILELDSWQCQGLGEARMSPSVAVFTTFFPDHLNYYARASKDASKKSSENTEQNLTESSAYKEGLHAYLADKANIFLYQKPEDTFVLGAQAASIVQEHYSERIRARTVIAGAEDFPHHWKLQLPGAHNRSNAALALESARALKIEDAVSRRALEQFSGVPGRLELVRTHNGLRFYNDTTATTPEATLAALAALDAGEHNLILIIGGADKGLAVDALLSALRAHTKYVVLLAGTGTDRVRGELSSSPVYNDLARAFDDAVAHAEIGDAVVLSPAFASFGMFKNEFDRGDQFNALVRAREI